MCTAVRVSPQEGPFVELGTRVDPSRLDSRLHASLPPAVTAHQGETQSVASWASTPCRLEQHQQRHQRQVEQETRPQVDLPYSTVLGSSRVYRRSPQEQAIARGGSGCPRCAHHSEHGRIAVIEELRQATERRALALRFVKEPSVASGERVVVEGERGARRLCFDSCGR